MVIDGVRHGALCVRAYVAEIRWDVAMRANL